MKHIPLTKGRFALVDDEDFQKVSAYSWEFTERGYAKRKRTKTQQPILMHRFILNLRKDECPVDHRDGDRLNNRKANLRKCDATQNQCNRGKQNNNTSGFKGVVRCTRTAHWRAQIGVNGRKKHLGTYATPEEAHEVYALWADMLHGEFANHGA